MKLKKVSRVLSLVVAGAMVLAMAPAAFADSCFHDHLTYVSNKDGATHKVICDDCKVELEKQESCFFVNGKCTKCDAPDPTCDHMYTDNGFVANNDGTHDVTCGRCGAVVSENVPCTYDANGECIQCHAKKPACDHMKQHFKFVANNNGTHDVLCADCDAVLSENVPCTYVDGKCQICGATCDHMANSWKYESTDHGTHKVICAVCGKTVDELGCVYINGKCQTCGAPEPACDHMGQHFKFAANNNGTHNVLCADCGAVVSENVPCTYVDGKCQQCGGLYDVASNVPFPISIGKGLLRSLRSFFMSLFIR